VGAQGQRGREGGPVFSLPGFQVFVVEHEWKGIKEC
jgi:hypothetical protein